LYLIIPYLTSPDKRLAKIRQWRTFGQMEFIETRIFTQQILELLPDDEYRLLQTLLMDQPDKGDIIKNGGGIRKVRFAAQGKGKSGGIRASFTTGYVMIA